MSVIRAFAATVRHASVARAADELCITPGAISRAVRELEAEVGYALFHRTGRTLAPTTAARLLADDIAVGLGQIAGAVERARRYGKRRAIVLSSEPTLLIRWLIPRLPGLEAALGDHDLRLTSAGGPVQFGADGIDFAIRRADFPIDADQLAEPFLEERVGPVCRPGSDVIAISEDYVDALVIETATRPTAWKDWAASRGFGLHRRRTLTFEHFYQSLQAASSGAGVAIGPVALVADELMAGTLHAPLGLDLDGTCYVLIAPGRSTDSSTFATILQWLRQEADLTAPRWR
jgi:DNA-binding transcriptional LysR family regulator